MKNKIYQLVILCFASLTIGGQGISPAVETLDLNNVNATVYSNGNYFWDLSGSPLYFVPADSGTSTIFSLSTWIAGKDVNDSLRLAAQRYSGQEFLPGPIVDISQFNDTITAQDYNKIWKIDHFVIDEFINEWNLGNVTNGTYQIPDVISSWPGNHPSLSTGLAPYIDYNNDGEYNPIDGDYPELMGDQMLWWVYNDNTIHECSGGSPMGVEIRVSFYAYHFANPYNDITELINNTTLLNLEIVNRSNQLYDSTYFGLYTDFDIGNPDDDYIGCHVDLNTFYAYNADDVDDPYAGLAFGGPLPPPPSQSVTLLKGPEADLNDGIDNNRNGLIDEPRESWGLTNFMFFNNSIGAMADPETDSEFYSYMRSIWKDGSPLVYGSYGYPDNSSVTYTQTSYAFPFDSDSLGWGQNGLIMPPWQEVDSINAPGDRRGVGSSGPFTFAVDEIITLDYSLNFTRSDTGNAFASVMKSMEYIPIIYEYFNDETFPSSYSIDENIKNKESILIYPNPANDNLNISSSSNIRLTQIYSISGSLIRSFEGNEAQYALKVSDLECGTYLLKIFTERFIFNRKIVIVR